MNPSLASKFFVGMFVPIKEKDHLGTELILGDNSTLVSIAFLWKAYPILEGRISVELLSKPVVDQRYRSKLPHRPVVSNKSSLLQLILRVCRFRPSGTHQVDAYNPRTTGDQPGRENSFNLISKC